MSVQARKLRDLFDAGEHFIAADCYSAITGRVVQHVGFKAAYVGGHATSAFHYAVPDNGIYSQVEQIEQASRIANAIDIPLVSDADSLGETVADAFHFTRRYTQTQIAGFHVEDEINPKHSSYRGGLIPIPEMQARLEACVKGRGQSPFVIIARCNEMFSIAAGGGGGSSLSEAIARGKAYAEAGADAVIYSSLTPEMVPEVRAAVPIPLVGLGPTLPDTVCTLSMAWGWRGAVRYHLEKARELHETGKVTYSKVAEEKALIDQDLYDALIRDWCEKTGRPLR